MFIFVSSFNFNLHIDWVIYNLRYIKFAASLEIADRRIVCDCTVRCACGVRCQSASSFTNERKMNENKKIYLRSCRYALSAQPPGECITKTSHSYVFLTIVLIKMSTGKKPTWQFRNTHTACRIVEHAFRWLGPFTPSSLTPLLWHQISAAFCATREHHIDRLLHCSALWWTNEQRLDSAVAREKASRVQVDLACVCKYAAHIVCQTWGWWWWKAKTTQQINMSLSARMQLHEPEHNRNADATHMHVYMPDALLTIQRIPTISQIARLPLLPHNLFYFFVMPPSPSPPLLPSNSHSKLINIKTIAFICAIMRWFLLSSGGLTNRTYLFWVFRRQYSKLAAHDTDAMQINTLGWSGRR